MLTNSNSQYGAARTPQTSPIIRYHAICTNCDWEHYSSYRRRSYVGNTTHKRQNSQTRDGANEHVKRTGHTVNLKRIEVVRPPNG